MDAGLSVEQSVEGDGLVTTTRGIAIGVLGADCAPILFVDAENGVVGAAHGGWKGAVGGITDEVIKVMTELGAEIPRIRCAIGPAIQRASYEVGDDLREKVFSHSSLKPEKFFDRGNPGHWLFDLPGYIAARVRAAGVHDVDSLGLDTYADSERFFSFRRACHQERIEYGRQMGVIALV